MFIMIDGIDGAGKTTIVNAWRQWLESSGRVVFDAIKFEKTEGRIPTIEDAQDASVIISGEPTYAGLGKKLRDEMLTPGASFSANEITEAFAEQRRELYETLIIPALQHELLIIQDRGITSSLSYQPTMSPDITEEFVAGLTGNELALKYRPDIVLLCIAPIDIALARLAGRAEKKDNAIFEERERLSKIAERFETGTWKQYLTNRGTRFVYFKADQNLPDALAHAITLLQEFMG